MVTSVLYHPIFLSTRQFPRSGKKYLWSSLQHSDEREAAFEGGRTVDGAIPQGPTSSTPAVQCMWNGCNTRERGTGAVVEVGYVKADR